MFNPFIALWSAFQPEIPVIVGYESVEGDSAPKPQFKAPSNYKTTEARQAYVKQKRQAFSRIRNKAPFFCRLSAVQLIYPHKRSMARPSFSGDGCALKVKRHLEEIFPGEWGNRESAERPSHGRVRFYGHDVKLFMKILATECALAGEPCPGSMWFGGFRTHELEDVVLPKQVHGVMTLNSALVKLGAVHTEDYDFGVDATRDASIAECALAKLGLL